MKHLRYTAIEGKSLGYLGLLGGLGLLVLLGFFAFVTMEHAGHYITGMTNQVVWGMPHVFAVFLIVAASGALNVASIASVFNKKFYLPLSKLSAVLAISLLIGGLVVLLLDLGRPDRLIVAITYYNFKSIFAWNIILYTGFIAFTGVYLWTMLDRNVAGFKKIAGTAAFIWRLILTTGTGSIFGFLVAREAYDAALYAPMFIIMSFAFGLAIYLLVLMASYKWTDRPLGDVVINRLKNLLGVFVAAVLYFTAVYHVTNLYATEHHAVESFILMDGGIYTRLFWIGQVFIGGILPLALLYCPRPSQHRAMIGLASVLVIIGGLCQMYVIIIGGQAFPLDIYPGYEVVSSSFSDGVVSPYTPSVWEIMLGLGGFAISLIIVALALKIFRLIPEDLSDRLADPHNG